MELKNIHCFLVHPSKNEDEKPSIGGTTVTKKTVKLHKMLKHIFDSALEECRIDIAFTHGPKGEQQNECRDVVLDYVKAHGIAEGRKIAERLQTVTTNKSGLGLLFLMAGQAGDRSRLVISRFPADQGVLAEENKGALTVEFIEKVFMKSATSYKAVAFEGKTAGGNSFWTGRAVDKQMNVPGDHVANYWIRQFLASELKTTAAAGTMRLAVALQSALKNAPDPETKAKIAAAATLASGMDGTVTSGHEFCQKYGLAGGAEQAVQAALRHPSLMAEQFKFDAAEFQRHVHFRTMELDNGGMLTAEAINFDKVFKTEPVKNTEGEVEITTRGTIVDQRLRRGKL